MCSLHRLISTKKDQNSSGMKILTKIYQYNLDCQTESIENGISKHEALSSDSVEKKVITTKKSGFCFTIGYKQVKQ